MQSQWEILTITFEAHRILIVLKEEPLFFKMQ